MPYQVLHGDDPWYNYARHETEESAIAHVSELETSRLEDNEVSKTWRYSGRGSAFMKPKFDPVPYTYKEV